MVNKFKILRQSLSSFQVKELERQLQKATSGNESKQKEEKISTVVSRKVEQKTSATGKEREEVQEEVIENGLVSEVEKALSSFQLSWDSQRKEDVIGNSDLFKSDHSVIILFLPWLTLNSCFSFHQSL